MGGGGGEGTRNVEPTVRDIQGRMVGERERGGGGSDIENITQKQAPRTRRQ